MKELRLGRLRQGWGYDEGQDLRNFTVDEGASRNKAMFERVKAGDILLVPRLPKWEEVAVVEATNDWETGYEYRIDEKLGDFGHIFPARYLKSFNRYSSIVTGNLRSTLKNMSRFWNINHYSEDVDSLIKAPESDLSIRLDHQARLDSTIEDVFERVFSDGKFTDELFKELTSQFSNEEWESALVHGLKKLFPNYTIDVTGNREEEKHGTDILVKIPGIIPGRQYAIAIQVKDYEGFVGEKVIAQINKADQYYWGADIKLIDKIVIITKAHRDENLKLAETDQTVRFIFDRDLKVILAQIAKAHLGLSID
jgi:hypothetical protein